MNSSHALHRRARLGFTIIELLVAMIIVGMVSAIVYSTFFSVIASTETTNTASEQLYTQSFLTRHVNAHISQASAGWQPGAVFRPFSDANAPIAFVTDESIFSFVGVDNGNEDRLSFTTSVPMSGSGGLPGYYKQVTYEVVDGGSVEFPEASPYAQQGSSGLVLLVTEVPLMSYDGLLEGALMSDRVSAFADHAERLEIATPLWTFPVGGMDIKYHNGEDWVDAWDMDVEERLPWAIEMIFTWSPWGDDRSGSLSKEPEDQFRMVIAVPGGMGLLNAAPDYGRPTVEVK